MTALDRTRQRMPSRRRFLRHMLRNAAVGGGIIAFSLGIGIVGYRELAQLSWVDALLNAAMILTGMGPTSPLRTTSAKLFATAYALYSGIAFLSTVAVLIAPVVHRFLHRFHLELSARGE